MKVNTLSVVIAPIPYSVRDPGDPGREFFEATPRGDGASRGRGRGGEDRIQPQHRRLGPPPAKPRASQLGPRLGPEPRRHPGVPNRDQRPSELPLPRRFAPAQVGCGSEAPTMDTQENLQLSVANFGPIAKADIDLRPLTVFVGPSNTGKSYLAILIYALHKFFGGRQITPLLYRYVDRTIFNRLYGFEGPTVSPRELETLCDWIDNTIIKSVKRDPKDLVTSLPQTVADIVHPMLEKVSSKGAAWNDTVAREFGVEDTRSLIRNRISGGISVAISRSISPEFTDQLFRYDFSIKGTQSEISSAISKAVPLNMIKKYSDAFHRTIHRSAGLPIDELRSNGEEFQYLIRSILTGLTEAVGSSIVTPLTRAAHYLPADRTTLMHAHRVVVRSIIAQAPRASLQHDTALPLSGVLADFLEQLIGLEDKPIKNPNDNLAAQIERDILGGEVILERSEVGYPEFFYRPRGWKHDNLRLINTSSMVSELAPVVLYLRHVIKPGDVLIIEEPESHLHPKMQVEFTRYLAAAVKAGIRIMITTHSEWVMDELANLVYLSHLPKSKRDGISGAKFALKPSQVGAWLFEPKKVPKGSVVKEITFSAEYGGFETRFEDVAIGTHNSYATIANRLAGLLPA